MPKICVTFYFSITSPKLTVLVSYSIVLSRHMPKEMYLVGGSVVALLMVTLLHLGPADRLFHRALQILDVTTRFCCLQLGHHCIGQHIFCASSRVQMSLPYLNTQKGTLTCVNVPIHSTLLVL